MLRRSLPLALALSLLAAPTRADEATDQAKALFNAGAQAYEVGKYLAAIQAFTEAYRLSPRPGIAFSIAQAYRRQYAADRRPEHLRAAVQHYREYVAKVEQGGRRAEAVQALAELTPMLDRLGADAPAAAAPARRASTQLMVSAQTREAMISLDGGKPVEAPLIAEVKPGKHRVELSAPGYFPEEREIQAAEGNTVALDIPMRERPAELTLETRDGADVTIDGRVVASTPLARPIEVAPGRHFVTVVRRGYRAFAEDVELGRGEKRKMVARLEVTGQRIGAYVLTGVAVAGAAAGGVLTGFTLYHQHRAQSLDDRRLAKGGLTGDDLSAYNAAKGARDDFRRAAGGALAGTFAVGVTAALLAVFDLPSVSAAARRDEGPKAPAPTRERTMEMAATPVLGPGFYGVSVGARF